MEEHTQSQCGAGRRGKRRGQRGQSPGRRRSRTPTCSESVETECPSSRFKRELTKFMACKMMCRMLPLQEKGTLKTSIDDVMRQGQIVTDMSARIDRMVQRTIKQSIRAAIIMKTIKDKKEHNINTETLKQIANSSNRSTDQSMRVPSLQTRSIRGYNSLGTTRPTVNISDVRVHGMSESRPTNQSMRVSSRRTPSRRGYSSPVTTRPAVNENDVDLHFLSNPGQNTGRKP